MSAIEMSIEGGKQQWMRCPVCKWEGWAHQLVGGWACCPRCYQHETDDDRFVRLKIFEVEELAGDVMLVGEGVS